MKIIKTNCVELTRYEISRIATVLVDFDHERRKNCDSANCAWMWNVLAVRQFKGGMRRFHHILKLKHLLQDFRTYFRRVKNSENIIARYETTISNLECVCKNKKFQEKDEALDVMNRMKVDKNLYEVRKCYQCKAFHIKKKLTLKDHFPKVRDRSRGDMSPSDD